MKPGWQSSEFWIALVGQALAVLALTGAINVGDKDKIETALANTVTAVFTILSSAAVVVRYINSRSELKSQALTATQPSRTPSLLPLIVAALLFWPAPTQATPPSVPTCLMCRNRTDPALMALLQQLAQNQQTIIALLQQRMPPPNAAPAQPPPLIIMVPGGPQQSIPLGPAPRQEIPLGGSPRQDIPLGAAPQQNIPLGAPPQQNIPLGPSPRQTIPLAPTPGEVKPVPSAMQRYLSRS
jgi:hypothetical protein